MSDVSSVLKREMKAAWSGSLKERGLVDLWDSYRIDLVTELDRLPADDPEKATIRNLLDPAQSRKAWESLYEAEQRLAFKRDDDNVKADWTRRCVEATNLGVKSADLLKEQFLNDVGTAVSRKAVYLTLLDELHFRYAKRRLDRQTRKQTATWLNFTGLLICVLGLAVLITGWSLQSWLKPYLGEVHLIFAIWCGVLGAYFSSSVAMRTTLATLDYDLLVAGYSKWSVIQRLLIGGIAAFLMYLLIAGGLLGGDLFPKLTYGQALLDGNPAATVLAIPSDQLAKLLVWSVIAGFSERLLPDQLGRLESSVRNAGQDRERASN